MPLILKEGLIEKDDLLKENIFAINSSRAKSQDIRPLKIAIVNLMPNKEETEINLLKLLSSQVLQIEVDLVRTASYISKHSDNTRLEKYYKTIDDIKNDKYDGLIITGAPLEKKSYEEIDYWDELKEIFEFAKTNVYSSLFICWGAVASLEYFYNIRSENVDKKIFGIYGYEKKNVSKLLEGLDDYFSIPQSRYKKLDSEKIDPSILKILASDDQTGVSLLESIDGRFVFNLGHLEYPKETLHEEYIRDINKRIKIDKPINYYKGSDPNQEDIIMRWKSTAYIFFYNWLNYYIYQKTPYKIEVISKYLETLFKSAGYVRKVRRVFNGTSNFILKQLEDGLSFDKALKLAKEKSYAEADTFADIDGIDIKRKINIISSLLFDRFINEDDIETIGIRDIKK